MNRWFTSLVKSKLLLQLQPVIWLVFFLVFNSKWERKSEKTFVLNFYYFRVMVLKWPGTFKDVFHSILHSPFLVSIKFPAFLTHSLCVKGTFVYRIYFRVFYKPYTPAIMAATGVINFHRTSPQPTACRYPTCSLRTATGSNKDPRHGLNLLRWLVVISCFTLLTIFFYPSIPVSFYLYFPSLFSFLFQVFILLFILTFSLLISFLSSTK